MWFKKNKWIIALIPIYLVYYFVIYLYLGIGDDIWEDVVCKIKKRKVD